jgi:hypothetical protein
MSSLVVFSRLFSLLLLLYLSVIKNGLLPQCTPEHSATYVHSPRRLATSAGVDSRW